MKWFSIPNVGACIMSYVAGIVNAVAFLHLAGFVSHVSGTSTRVGMALDEDGSMVTKALAIITGYVVGSAMTGVTIPQAGAIDPKRFSTLIAVSGCVLMVCAGVTNQQWGKFLAAMSCGMQNAVATTYSARAFAGKFLIRTTHFTGAATDLGISSGRITGLFTRAKGDPKNLRDTERERMAFEVMKVFFLGMFFICFIAGAQTGKVMVDDFAEPANAFLVPGGILVAAAMTHAGYTTATNQTDPSKTYSKTLQRMQTQAAGMK